MSNVSSVMSDDCLKQIVLQNRGGLCKYILQPCAGNRMSRVGCAVVSPPKFISAYQSVRPRITAPDVMRECIGLARPPHLERGEVSQPPRPDTASYREHLSRRADVELQWMRCFSAAQMLRLLQRHCLAAALRKVLADSVGTAA